MYLYFALFSSSVTIESIPFLLCPAFLDFLIFHFCFFRIIRLKKPLSWIYVFLRLLTSCLSHIFYFFLELPFLQVSCPSYASFIVIFEPSLFSKLILLFFYSWQKRAFASYKLPYHSQRRKSTSTCFLLLSLFET